MLLFRLLVRTTNSLGPSAFVAVVFGLHPLHVESVAWAAERKDVLSAFFWILTTQAYVSWVERRTPGRYAAVLAFFVLGLLSKPMLVTLPFTLLLLDAWPLARKGAPWLAREKLPLFLLAGASSVVTFLVQRAGGAMALGEQIAPGLRAENALVACAAYLVKAVVPVHLLVHYPYPTDGYAAWKVAGAGLLLAAATAFAWKQWKPRPWIAVGWLWFLGTLVPVIGLVQVGPQALADRYTYVPMIGLAVAVGFGVAEIARRAGATLLAVTAIACALLTWRQVGLWKDDRTLFGYLVEASPGNHLGHGILGNVELHEARYDAAIADYREALRLQPDYPLWWSNLGRAYLLTGHPEEARAALENALRLDAGHAAAHHQLGFLLATQGRTDEAIAHFEAALRTDPDLHEVHYNLGLALMSRGRVAEATAHFERALELSPGFTAARTSLAAAPAAR